MRKFILFAALLLPIFISAQGTVIDTFFYSNVLARECSMMVYLPEGYDTSTINYPVIYVLHGATQNWNSNPMVFDTVDVLIEEQVIYPVIVVHPQGSALPYLGSWYTNSELYGNYETCMVIDVIEFIDANFRTITERDKRSVMGFSMGGYGAMKLGLKHPDIYCAIASHSGAIDHKIYFPCWIPHILQENGGTPPYNYTYGAGIYTNLTFSIAGAYSPDTTNPPYYVNIPLDSLGDIIDSIWLQWDPHYLPHLAAQIPPGTELAIYFDCGSQDELYFYQSNLAFTDSLDILGLPYEFHSYNGTHTSGILGRIRTSMAFLDSIMHTGISEDEGYKIPDIRHTLAITPNPFSRNTTFSFSTEQSVKNAEIIIYDATGHLIKSFRLTPYAVRSTLIWHGDDDGGTKLPCGVYFAKFASGNLVETKKVSLIR